MWPTLTGGVMMPVVGLPLGLCEGSKIDVTLSVPAKSLRLEVGGAEAVIACVPNVVCGSRLTCSRNKVGDRGGDPPIIS